MISDNDVPFALLFKDNMQLLESLKFTLIADQQEFKSGKITEGEFKYAFAGAMTSMMALMKSMLRYEKDIDSALTTEPQRIALRKYFAGLKSQFNELNNSLQESKDIDG